MGRTLRSAKQAGARFNREMADYLAEEAPPGISDAIDVQPLSGVKDKGDIRGVRAGPHKIAVECKNQVKMELAVWLREAEVERDNAGADIGVVFHKRKGKGSPEDQYVTMAARDFVRLLGWLHEQ